MIKLLIISFSLFSCKKDIAQITKRETAAKNNIENTRRVPIVKNDWSGKWIYTKKDKNSDVPEEQFTLTILQHGNNVRAQYCAISESGGKIDCESEEEYNVIGKLENGKITGEFYSFFGSSKDKRKFEISTSGINTISWKVVTPPKSIFYTPDNCVLVRKPEKSLTEKQDIEESSTQLLPVDYKDLDYKKGLIFNSTPNEWLKQAFLQKYDLTADGSIEIFSKDSYNFFLIENIGGDSEVIYIISTKDNKIIDGLSIADSNGDSNTTKEFSIGKSNNISIYEKTGNKRNLIAKYSCNNVGSFVKY